MKQVEASMQRVSVVTASTTGIGLATAHALAAQGMHVVICSRRAENVADALVSLHKRYGPKSASGLQCNVALEADRQSLLGHVLERTPSVSALVLNAAVSPVFGPLVDTTESQWDKIFAVNVKSAFLLVKLFHPYLQRGSSVVFVSSIAAYNTLPGLAAYSVSKTALLGLTKALAVELAGRGIRVNGVAPGIIRTKFSEVLWKGGRYDQGRVGGEDPMLWGVNRQQFVPMKRVGEPRDVADVVAFLLSDSAAYITGETIVIAGGVSSKL